MLKIEGLKLAPGESEALLYERAAAALTAAIILCLKGEFNLSFFILALYLFVMSIIKI